MKLWRWKCRKDQPVHEGNSSKVATNFKKHYGFERLGQIRNSRSVRVLKALHLRNDSWEQRRGERMGTEP